MFGSVHFRLCETFESFSELIFLAGPPARIIITARTIYDAG